MDIAVIGAAGSVGRAVCTQLLATGAIGPGEKLQLVGRRGGASETGVYGLRIDLLDAYGLRAPTIEAVLDGDDIDADIVIMVAGETPALDPARPTSRDAVAAANLPVFEYYAEMLDIHGDKDELVIIQSNPVELAVKVFSDRLGRSRVVGAGAYNDTLRFRRELLAGLESVPSNPVITGYILGEHGPNAVPIWSSVKAGGLVPAQWNEHLERVRPQHSLSELGATAAAARARLAELLRDHKAQEATEFVAELSPDVRALVKPWFAHWSGRTSTATAHSAVDLVAALQSGHNVVLPLQVQLQQNEWLGVETVMGVPVSIDATGWQSVVEIALTDEERQALLASADAINTQLETWMS